MHFSIDDIIASLQHVQEGLPVSSLSRNLRYGAHLSQFLPEGLDFHQCIEYDPEVHTIGQIDWRMTDTKGTVYARENIEEREFPLLVLADISRSMLFGFTQERKARLLLETVGLIGFTAVREQDPIGLVGFMDKPLFHEEPRVSQGHVYYLVRLLYDILNHDEDIRLGETDFIKPLQLAAQRMQWPGMIVILSDFVGGENIAHAPELKSLASKHDVMCVVISDEDEFVFPRGSGYIRESNMETGETLEVSVKSIRRRSGEVLGRRERMMRELAQVGVGSTVLRYGDHVTKLTQFFAERGSCK